MTRKAGISLLLFFISVAGCCQEKAGTIHHALTGKYTLSYYLPAGFDSNLVYNVLYVNDGQTIFGERGLNMDGMADELVGKKIIEPVIIVGIHSDHNRTSNYVPYADAGARMDFGDYTPNVEAYSEGIINTIIPFIEKACKVRKRGIAGYSFGGLHATWMSLHYPGLFAFCGSLSPSYWVNDFEIFTEAAKGLPTQTYYFDVGTGEWNYYVPMLLHSKLTVLENIFYYEDPGASHNLESWRGQRVRNILLLFNNNPSGQPYTWANHLEVIKSSNSGKFYLRINPIITYANGLVCSISYAATFKLKNPEDGILNKDGSFTFINPKTLEASVTFRNEEKIININFEEVEKLKTRK